MEYDYSQTQGVWNDKAGSKAIEGYDFRPVLGAVAKWDDGNDSTGYFHFTESWRSVKTQGWCINAALAEKGNEAKLARALTLVDFFYGEKGHALNSYGPESEGYTDGTINYQGREVPKFTTKALEQLNDANIGRGSYTDYLRKFVGATLPVGSIKEQGMEYQCTSANAKNGLRIINKAIEEGTYKHVEVSAQENPFFTIVPSAFALSGGQAEAKAALESKDKLGSINSNGSTSAYNPWDDYVMYGFGGTKGAETLETKEQYLALINTTWQLAKLVKIYQDAYDIMTA
jgi:putative aldouronate transport system substrate-binding protein